MVHRPRREKPVFVESAQSIEDSWLTVNLQRGMNPARWYEYALSSSLMIVIIAMLCGMYDMSSLILIFSLNATMNLFGLMMEKQNQTTERVDWTAFIFGCFAGIVPWITIGMYLVGAAQSAGKSFAGSLDMDLSHPIVSGRVGCSVAADTAPDCGG